MTKRFLLAVYTITAFIASTTSITKAEGPALELKPRDHIVYIGNTMADRMQHDGYLETQIHAIFPDHRLTFRNLGFPGDTLTTRSRSKDFGNPDQWLTKCEADVVLCFFGYNEALLGDDSLAKFEADLIKLIDDMRSQKYNGDSAPKIVIVSPIAHENLYSPHLPDGSANNTKLAKYTESMRGICKANNVTFVDVFSFTQKVYDKSNPLTMNGIHLNSKGNELVGKHIAGQLFGKQPTQTKTELERIRKAVLDKNHHWFSRYRVVDGYNVYGGRSTLNWHGQSNADVMKREMEIFDVKTANRDRGVWAVAQGHDLVVKDNNLPKELDVVTNKIGPNPDGSWPYMEANDAIEKMTIAKGMQVNVFASEELFPRLVNPVQMAVDTDSRVWCSVWPSYPHWNPTEPARDALLIFPDEDNNGVADECIVFADELNSVTGFEFWNGGVLVAAPPEIWFLKDTDGDDKADVKVRMLQGVSSADTHHSANAVVVGPDGWMYWSRGIFNVANFETPTKTFRSGASGVHRFNPRTFEFEFHFPIGPNPHGDVIDQWGYQFANDGTGGTGSYVNIGKGIGNKKWFRKRVRPVPATGILSSNHFPKKNRGNFLICNAIGFLGVLQHEVNYDGADITATEIEPVLVSSDPNFRPSDVEMGGDGALYVSDWHNTLIGHMQHNMRDPNRDHEHGRIYRVTAVGRETDTPAKMKGKPIHEVCQNFFDVGNAVRYRARLELTSRSAAEIINEVQKFADGLNPKSVTEGRDEAQALLESLWVFEEQRIVNIDLAKKVFQAKEPRVRAAAIRTVGHWAGRVSDWHDLLLTAARDPAGLVRAEAAKAAVEFGVDASPDILYEVAARRTDPELNTVINYAKKTFKIDDLLKQTLAAGKTLSPAAQAYALKSANVDQLLKMEKTEAVHRAILGRTNTKVDDLAASLDGLSKMQGKDSLDVLMDMISDARRNTDSNVIGLGSLLIRQSPDKLQRVRRKIETIATKGETAELKRLGYAAWVAAAGPDDAFLAASKNKENLRDFLDSVASVHPQVRPQLFNKIEPLIFELPSNMQSEAGSELSETGIFVEYYHPSGKDVAMETLDKMKPRDSGVVPKIVMNVPQRKQQDQFALRFTGNVIAPKSGKYTFSVASDDGSRIYINDKLVVNNDGLHGMVEKSANIDLPAGAHKLVVTYFDNGGGDGLNVSWAGPGFGKQNIPETNLSISGGETLHDVAIGALAAISGNDARKFKSLASLVAKGRSRPAAIKVLRTIPSEAWAKNLIRPLANDLVGFLSEMPARFRTGESATDAIALTKSLAEKLPANVRQSLEQRLQNLDVRLIAIGTVPHRMIYDKELIVVQAGQPVEFRLSNTDAMPHNFAITRPGSLQEVGELGEATGRDADAESRHYIPKSDRILLSSKLLQPGTEQALAFDVPSEPGVYPYVCTYPGHWRRMFGALYVVADLEQYQADKETYLAKANLEIKDELLKMIGRSHEWKFDELVGDLDQLHHGRSYEVGRELFKVASCVACHKLGGEGNVFGPDLVKLDEKKSKADAILHAILDPSKDIDDKFRSTIFAMDDGSIITGMVTKEMDDEVHVVINPLAKGKPTILATDEIVQRKKSPVSLMPKGLLDKLTREEILDLIGYVLAKGDKKHMMFKDHEHH